MKEILKPIENCHQYFISDFGKVYSQKNGRLKELKQFADSNGHYMMIGLIDNGGSRKKIFGTSISGQSIYTKSKQFARG